MRLVHALAFVVGAAAAAPGDTPPGEPLARTSPFQAVPTAPAGHVPVYPLELAGVSSAGGQTIVCLFDNRVSKSLWLPVGTTHGLLAVLSYDAKSEQAVISVNGVRRTLTLAQSAAVTAPPKHPTAAEIKRQQDEARMLVSDLLDIGMEQRRANDAAKPPAATPVSH